MENKAIIWSSNSISGYLSKGNEITSSKRYLCPLFIVTLLTIVKLWKQQKCLSMDEWMKKLFYTHTHTHEILFSHKNKAFLAFCDNMYETWRNCAKGDKSEKDECCMISLISLKCGIKKKNLQKKRSHLWLPEAGGYRGNWKHGGQNVQFPIIRSLGTRNVMYSVVRTVNTIGCYIWKLLRA